MEETKARNDAVLERVRRRSWGVRAPLSANSFWTSRRQFTFSASKYSRPANLVFQDGTRRTRFARESPPYRWFLQGNLAVGQPFGKIHEDITPPRAVRLSLRYQHWANAGDSRMERIIVKISARNLLPGTVKGIAKGAVNSEIVLSLRGGETIVAVITNPSVDRLGL